MDYAHWPFYLVHLAGVRYPMKWLVTLPKSWYDRRWCSDTLVVTSGCLDYCLWSPTCLILPTADIHKAFSSTRNPFSLRKPFSVNPRGGCATEENPSWSAVCYIFKTVFLAPTTMSHLKSFIFSSLPLSAARSELQHIFIRTYWI